MTAEQPVSTVAHRGPDDWPTDPERTYARRQAALAEEAGVDVSSRVVETESAGRIHYLVGGNPDGEPVVLLHGINVPGATWLPLVPTLADEYRLYIPDRPGVGLSDPHTYSYDELRRFPVEYLLELFDAEELARPHVVANSLGGLQAFLLAIDHDRAASLGFLGAPAGLTSDFDLFYRLLSARGFNELLYWYMYQGDPMENTKEMVADFFVTDDSAISRAFYELLAANEQLPGRVKSEQSLARAETSWGQFHPVFDLSEQVVSLAVPAVFIWGTEDAFWEPDAGRDIVAAMPDAALHELQGYGHGPWLEPGDTASELLRDFLDEQVA